MDLHGGGALDPLLTSAFAASRSLESAAAGAEPLAELSGGAVAQVLHRPMIDMCLIARRRPRAPLSGGSLPTAMPLTSAFAASRSLASAAAGAEPLAELGGGAVAASMIEMLMCCVGAGGQAPPLASLASLASLAALSSLRQRWEFPRQARGWPADSRGLRSGAGRGPRFPLHAPHLMGLGIGIGV